MRKVVAGMTKKKAVAVDDETRDDNPCHSQNKQRRLVKRSEKAVAVDDETRDDTPCHSQNKRRRLVKRSDRKTDSHSNLVADDFTLHLPKQMDESRSGEILDAKELDICCAHQDGDLVEFSGATRPYEMTLAPQNLPVSRYDYESSNLLEAQYVRMAACTLSQEDRLLKTGRLRKETGYDFADPFIDDSHKDEVLIPGTIVSIIGREAPFAYVRRCEAPSEKHVLRNVDTNVEVLLHRCHFMPLPRRFPQPGDWVVPFGLTGHFEKYNGHRCFCGPINSESVGSGESDVQHWVTFDVLTQPEKTSSLPTKMVVAAKHLFALPGPSTRDPPAPLDARTAPKSIWPPAPKRRKITPARLDRGCVQRALPVPSTRDPPAPLDARTAPKNICPPAPKRRKITPARLDRGCVQREVARIP